METIRTFIALEIPENLRKVISGIQQRLIRNTGGIRWVKPENMHLTLKFLGSTKSERVKEISTGLENAAKEYCPFVINISGIGAFPNPGNPKVIWAGIAENKQLWSFQKRLDNALSELEFPVEKRAFSPHLTLGRVKDTRIKKELGLVLRDFSLDDRDSFEASRIVFFRSDLHPTGPVYTVLKEIKLSN